MSAGVRVHGLAELDRRLKEMPNAVAGKVLRNASNAAARVVRDEARRRAPKDTGDLAKEIVTRQRRRGVQHGVVVSIGLTTKAWYAHFVLFGTKVHEIAATRFTKWGRRHGKGKQLLTNQKTGEVFGTVVTHPGVRPNEFLVEALEAKQDEAIKVLGDRIWQGIVQELGTGGGA